MDGLFDRLTSGMGNIGGNDPSIEGKTSKNVVGGSYNIKNVKIGGPDELNKKLKSILKNANIGELNVESSAPKSNVNFGSDPGENLKEFVRFYITTNMQASVPSAGFSEQSLDALSKASGISRNDLDLKLSHLKFGADIKKDIKERDIYHMEVKKAPSGKGKSQISDTHIAQPKEAIQAVDNVAEPKEVSKKTLKVSGPIENFKLGIDKTDEGGNPVMKEGKKIRDIYVTLDTYLDHMDEFSSGCEHDDYFIGNVCLVDKNMFVEAIEAHLENLGIILEATSAMSNILAPKAEVTSVDKREKNTKTVNYEQQQVSEGATAAVKTSAKTQEKKRTEGPFKLTPEQIQRSQVADAARKEKQLEEQRDEIDADMTERTEKRQRKKEDVREEDARAEEDKRTGSL
jgi:hypothetical protein